MSLPIVMSKVNRPNGVIVFPAADLNECAAVVLSSVISEESILLKLSADKKLAAAPVSTKASILHFPQPMAI